MPSLQPVRGTHDLLPEAMRIHRHVTETARRTALNHGYEEVATPIFEFTQVFARTLGETSDVVTKEMYSFTDQGEDNLTLRPENTAGVARAFISNGLAQQVPCKFFYSGPMFRRERPQKGRQRQFHQIGVELLGAAQPLGDVEIIACGWELLRVLGLSDKVTLELNTLGDSESRIAYREALVAYFTEHQGQLSEDSRHRLIHNPLRILDSKNAGDREVIKNAPVFDDYLNDTSHRFFQQVREGLETLSIPYSRNPRLVRGLDYYGHTAFEFTTDALGAQGTVLAGGRYDGLIKQMGGPPTPGVGWAAGVERLALLVADSVPAPVRPVVFAPLGEEAESKALQLVADLRQQGLRVEMGYGGALKKRLKQADRLNARFAVILGDNELAEGVAVLRDLDSGEQNNIPLAELAAALQQVQP